MKAVMLSIQPRHCENICTEISNENGKPVYKKTNEVRKTVPKLETPFKCYIYCTKDKNYQIAPFRFVEGWKVKRFDEDTTYANGCTCNIGDTLNGKIIGEFVCDYIVPFRIACEMSVSVEAFQQSALSWEEFIKYAGNATYIYGWHISDLKIYDKPKELWEYSYPCTGKKCSKCQYEVRDELPFGTVGVCCGRYHITRPPQSWSYVEEIL